MRAWRLPRSDVLCESSWGDRMPMAESYRTFLWSATMAWASAMLGCGGSLTSPGATGGSGGASSSSVGTSGSTVAAGTGGMTGGVTSGTSTTGVTTTGTSGVTTTGGATTGGTGGTGGCGTSACCNPWSGLEPVPITMANCSDFDSDNS